MSLSKSGVETWFRCPRLWRYTYVDKVESVAPPSKEQRFGIGFHKLLEQYLLSQETDWSQVELSGAEKSTAAALLDAYKGHYGVPADVVGAEVPFQLAAIHGVFDGVYRDSEDVVILEHKTTKTDFSVDEFYWERVKQDWQVGMYQLAAREVYGTDNVRVLYDVSRVPQLRQRRGESAEELRERVKEDIASSPDRYFARAEIRWSEDALDRLRTDLHMVGKDVEFASNRGMFARSRKCHEFRRACEFIPVCFGDTPLTEERLYRPRTRR